MKTLSTDTHSHDTAQDDALFELLTKEGQDPGESPDNDEHMTAGVNPVQPVVGQPERVARPSGNVLHFSPEALRQNREELLDSLFDTKHEGAVSDQALLSKHFQHVATGDFETRSPMLKWKSKQKLASVETLVERVRALTGRH